AFILGAERVLAVDDVPGRLQMARDAGAIAIDMSQVDVHEAIREYTGGRGADACIDAVGMEAHGMTVGAIYDRIKTAMYLATDRFDALRQSIRCVRKAGTVSVPGVYGGLLDKVPFGEAFAKGLTFKMGQTHVHRYFKPLLDHIQAGRIDPTFIITHRLPLQEAATGYDIFSRDKSNVIKVVLTP
ncbi:MAG TPA: zinc-binding dehydrogenase, partial [Tepidisphaeraceae bacterium]|nr:zinc-binding dehydrogenase [Tepidisphaeraceae bacterium]